MLIGIPSTANQRADVGQGLGSVCVSFTPVHSRSPADAEWLSALVTDAGGRW